VRGGRGGDGPERQGGAGPVVWVDREGAGGLPQGEARAGERRDVLPSVGRAGGRGAGAEEGQGQGRAEEGQGQGRAEEGQGQGRAEEPKKAKAKAAPKKAKAKAAPKKAKAKAAPKKAKAKAALKKVKETVKKAAPKKKAEPVEAKISGKVFTFARRPQGWLPKTCPKCEKVVAKTLVQLTKLFGWRTPSGGHTIPQPQCRACRAVASRAAAAKKRRASIEESKKAAPKKKKAPAAGRGKKKKKAAGKAEKK
jgi:hypothetical protein